MDADSIGCLLPVAALGGIVGSFLNVVVFRLPRDLTIARPAWSFCPHCKTRIRAWDNIPIFGWLKLRGRCRDCSGSIAGIYPLIETLTALTFVMIWDALFIGRVLPPVGTNPSIWIHVPMFVAYVTLFGSLLATAAMDIEAYSIDIRVSVFAMVVGIACCGVWYGLVRPSRIVASGELQGALPPAVCVIASGMGLAWVVTALIGAGRSRLVDPHSIDAAVDGTDSSPTTDAEPADESAYADSAAAFQPVGVLILLGLLIGLVSWQALAPSRGIDGSWISPVGQRAFVISFAIMAVLIMASRVKRSADDQIIEEIEADRPKARATAASEFTHFLPAVIVGVIGCVAFRRLALFEADWPRLLGSATPYAAGLLEGAAGMVLAASIGWGVRIIGTLALGKEAFGTGDIYILAAIGAVAGLWVSLFAFFLAALLALVGVLATIFQKASRAIPFGPWLAFGAFVAIFARGALLTLFTPYGSGIWWLLTGHLLPGDPTSQPY